MKNLDFEWLDEFMLYCRSTQLREKTMRSYEQTIHLFGRCITAGQYSLPVLYWIYFN